ncbi:uncharacterized protein B0I36DRAFT_437044 [Microdochium trichocladiopsis]|uniref:Protein kinase domain-containing protein n=1 Tax=Microdochium trichocladiopsis TaxID=1682393 RepID=A0A9P8XPD9_9PEZI|nr:uncharacterized protein B0I36DRAFT_437044 [Microdochium trichocladiopsis]KAH7009211.1 hypothetical protein B0I36DRAFT_437044 [Microdochium trichocladiopsis]
MVTVAAEEIKSKSKVLMTQDLEPWELLENLGKGAFSQVYRARDLEGDAGEVAVKVVPKFKMNNQGRAMDSDTAGSIPLFATWRRDRYFRYELPSAWANRSRQRVDRLVPDACRPHECRRLGYWHLPG